jgi:probable rRNA maturation factor
MNSKSPTETPPQLSLTVQDASRATGVPARHTLRRWAGAAIHCRAAVTIRVVGTAEGRRLNRSFRGRDYATNVLAFEYGRTGGTLQGDIVLCAPVVRREARQQQKRLVAHYAHLVVHGLLHLQGEDHLTEAQARRMEARERRILHRLGYPDPYRVEHDEAIGHDGRGGSPGPGNGEA